MEIHKKLAVAGLAAGLIGGGAAGAIVTAGGVSGAAPATVTQDSGDDSGADSAPDTGVDAAPGAEGDRREPGAFLSDALAPLVEDGTITMEQAAAVIDALEAARPAGGHGPGHGPGGRGGPGGPRGVAGEAAAEALGITTDELREALGDGSTIADVAEAEGVDVQGVIDALVAEATSRIEEKVADGDLTPEEADEKLAELTERVTTAVNEGGRPPR